MHFQQKLARLMDHHRLSNKALGERLGIAHTTIGRWLAGESVPQDRLLRRLAAELAIDEVILTDDNFDLPEGTTDALYRGEYRVSPQSAKVVREDVERAADAKMWESFAPKIPHLVTRLGELHAEIDAIRETLLDYLPDEERERLRAAAKKQAESALQEAARIARERRRQKVSTGQKAVS